MPLNDLPDESKLKKIFFSQTMVVVAVEVAVALVVVVVTMTGEVVVVVTVMAAMVVVMGDMVVRFILDIEVGPPFSSYRRSEKFLTCYISNQK